MSCLNVFGVSVSAVYHFPAHWSQSLNKDHLFPLCARICVIGNLPSVSPIRLPTSAANINFLMKESICSHIWWAKAYTLSPSHSPNVSLATFLEVCHLLHRSVLPPLSLKYISLLWMSSASCYFLCDSPLWVISLHMFHFLCQQIRSWNDNLCLTLVFWWPLTLLRSGDVR